MIGGARTGPHQEIKLSRLFRHSTAQVRPHGASARLDKRAYPAKGRGGIDQLGCESCAVGRNRFVGMKGDEFCPECQLALIPARSDRLCECDHP